MYNVVKSSDNVAPYIVEYVVSTRADIDTLPVSPVCAPGSTCICIEDSRVWMFGDDDIWHEL